MGDMYTRECFSAIKNNENMPLAASWMDPEIVMQIELRQTICLMISLICSIKKKSHK